MCRVFPMLLLVAACSNSGQRSTSNSAFDAPELDGANGGTNGVADDLLAPAALNVLPAIANAGPDQEVIRGAVVTLDGRRSFHPLGQSFEQVWSQTSGSPVVTLSNATKATTTFTAPDTSTVLEFKLTTRLAGGTVNSDFVTIHVSPTVTRQAPTLLTDGDRIVSPFTQLTLGSFLLSGNVDTNIVWTQISGPLSEAVPSGPRGKTLSLRAPESGYVVFSVKGESDGLQSAPDFTVIAAQDNSGAKAAEQPTELMAIDTVPGTRVVLSVPDQSSASTWTQIIGDPVAFETRPNKDADWAFVAPDTPQTLWFSFVADSTALRTAPLVVQVIVADPSLDGLRAEAGEDQGAHPNVTVQLDARASVTAAGTAYEWVQTLGPLVTLSDATSPRPTFTAPDQEANLVFVLRLKGSTGYTAPDSVLVNVHPISMNDAPEGSIGATPIAGASFALTADVFDPDNDPLSCTWDAPDASFDSTSGNAVTMTLAGASTTVSLTCCDDLDPQACATFTRDLP